MYVTREADYAIRCVLYLSKEPGWIASAKEISESMDVPRSFLAKILQRLSKKGLVTSIRGMKGGFQLAKRPKVISLLEVIEAIQGPSAISACAIDRRICGRSRICAVHPIWVEIRKEVEKRLEREKFAKLVRGE